MGSTIEVVFTMIGISFWFLFPVGMFLSVSRLDKDTDQLVRLHHDQHHEEEEEAVQTRPPFRPVPFDWHHPIHVFWAWMQHE